jgi:hypothetical protein
MASGVFMHTGALALMTRHNEGAIANVGFVIGNDAVAVVDTGGSVREGARVLAAVRAYEQADSLRHQHACASRSHLRSCGLRERGRGVRRSSNLPRALAMRGQYYLDAYKRIMGEEIMADVKLIPPTQLTRQRHADSGFGSADSCPEGLAYGAHG